MKCNWSWSWSLKSEVRRESCHCWLNNKCLMHTCNAMPKLLMRTITSSLRGRSGGAEIRHSFTFLSIWYSVTNWAALWHKLWHLFFFLQQHFLNYLPSWCSFAAFLSQAPCSVLLAQLGGIATQKPVSATTSASMAVLMGCCFSRSECLPLPVEPCVNAAALVLFNSTRS